LSNQKENILIEKIRLPILESQKELVEEILDDPGEEIDYDETIWEENGDLEDEIEDDEDEDEYEELEEIDDLDDMNELEDDFSEIDVDTDDDSEKE